MSSTNHLSTDSIGLGCGTPVVHTSAVIMVSPAIALSSANHSETRQPALNAGIFRIAGAVCSTSWCVCSGSGHEDDHDQEIVRSCSVPVPLLSSNEVLCILMSHYRATATVDSDAHQQTFALL